MRITLIVPAGGSGSRFHKSLSRSSRALPTKLFYPLSGKPVITHSLSTLLQFPEIDEIVIPHPAGTRGRFQEILKDFEPSRIKLVEGGKTRAESVWNAVRKSDSRNDWVMVHDGARPLVEPSSIKKLFRISKNADGALLAKKVVPTIKQVRSDGRVERTVDRSTLFEAETPQLVRRDLLVKAYRENKSALLATDEASLLESVHAKIKVVSHEAWNPKITTFEDLELVEAYLDRKQGGTRTGFGRDTHRLVLGRKFYLGGIHIPSEKGALGHSDGDALLHAIADAVLGVIAAGDIGDWFSDKNPAFKNISSGKILTAVLSEAGKRGWQVEHVDTVIHLEKPKLGDLKIRMKKNLAAIMKLDKDSVSIKAKTAEGLGPVGEGLAVSCEALVTMKRNPS